MQNIFVKIKSEQEKSVLLAFLNALDYEFDLVSTQPPVPGDEHHPVVAHDEQSTLPHYATE